MKFFLTLAALFVSLPAAHGELKSYKRIGAHTVSYGAGGRKSYNIAGGDREQKEIPALIAKMISVQKCGWSNSSDFAAGLNDVNASEASQPNMATMKLRGCEKDQVVCGGSMHCELALKVSHGTRKFTAQFDGVMCQSNSGSDGACRDATKCFLQSGILANEQLAMETYGAGMEDEAREGDNQSAQ